ncbi:MAG: hypothetical protein ABII07_03290 [Patescibacteria group bacterium]|nr:hypothetical protein [Patescibacteria group bacterium]
MSLEENELGLAEKLVASYKRNKAIVELSRKSLSAEGKRLFYLLDVAGSNIDNDASLLSWIVDHLEHFADPNRFDIRMLEEAYVVLSQMPCTESVADLLRGVILCRHGLVRLGILEDGDDVEIIGWNPEVGHRIMIKSGQFLRTVDIELVRGGYAFFSLPNGLARIPIENLMLRKNLQLPGGVSVGPGWEIANQEKVRWLGEEETARLADEGIIFE